MRWWRRRSADRARSRLHPQGGRPSDREWIPEDWQPMRIVAISVDQRSRFPRPGSASSRLFQRSDAGLRHAGLAGRFVARRLGRMLRTPSSSIVLTSEPRGAGPRNRLTTSSRRPNPGAPARDAGRAEFRLRVLELVERQVGAEVHVAGAGDFGAARPAGSPGWTTNSRSRCSR